MNCGPQPKPCTKSSLRLHLAGSRHLRAASGCCQPSPWNVYLRDRASHLAVFLEHWEKFQYIPLGVLAHSTHLRGSGVMENGIEKPNIKVTLASKISEEACKRLNLGYLDRAKIRLDEWKDKEAEGILYVPRAGEILYRLRH
ncbi:MAG TPA: hypothetical protein VJM08_12230 [Anaerolineales bacterium]|nr:hypothetical protein [Anaerolineales bacterium]